MFESFFLGFLCGISPKASLQTRVVEDRPGDVVLLHFFEVARNISAIMSSGEKAAKSKAKAPSKTKSSKGMTRQMMFLSCLFRK